MQVTGSCRCGAVQFSVEAHCPYPFLLCYCSICRKSAGGGGYAINLGAKSDTLIIEGGEHIKVDGLASDRPTGGEHGRRFCGRCGTHLWNYDPRWPDLIHPFASVIDTELPMPPERTHMMLAYKASWVPLHLGPNDKTFDEYPDESLAMWHERMGFADA